MKIKRIIISSILVILCFFVFTNRVDAAYELLNGTWSIGNVKRLLNNNNIPVESIKKIVFNDTSKNPKVTGMSYSGNVQIPLNSDMPITWGVKGTTLYFQYSGTLQFDINSDYLFQDLTALESIEGFEYVSTEQTKYYDNMFYGCTSLKSLDLSHFNTSRVTSMTQMFYNCTSLESVNLSSFNTSRVASFSYMFYGCSSLETLDISNFNSNSSPTTTNMFTGATNLKRLKVSQMNVTIQLPVTLYDSELKSYDQFTNLMPNTILAKRYQLRPENSEWMYLLYGNPYGELPTPEKEGYIFDGWLNSKNEKISSTDIFLGDTTINAKWLVPTQFKVSFHDLFQDEKYSDVIRILNSDTLDTTKDLIILSPDNSQYTIYGWIDGKTLYYYTEADKIYLTDNTMSFKQLKNLTEIDFSKIDTSKVTSMFTMFLGCEKLSSLDLSGFDTSHVTNMAEMFAECYNLVSIDLTGFNTTNVGNMESMFRDCRKLASLNVSSFDTTSVGDMFNMFENCSSLKTLDLKNFNTSNVTRMSNMFKGCKNLEYLYMTNFDTSNVVYFSNMFSGCIKLEYLWISKFDFSKSSDYDNILENSRINNIQCPKKIGTKHITLPYKYIQSNGTIMRSLTDITDPYCYGGKRVGTITYYNTTTDSGIQIYDYITYDNETYGELYTPSKENYIFKGWFREDTFENQVTSDTEFDGENITLYPKYEIIQYSVTFVDDDNTVLKETTLYDINTLAADIIKPENPTKASDNQYTYVFKGWSPEIENVTKNITYKATYNKTVKKYTVVWKNYDGTVLETDENVEYGTFPSYDGVIPTKDGTAQYAYVFDNWYSGDLPLTPVSGDTTYIAKFNEVINKHTVTFIDGMDNTIIKDAVEYNYGTTYDNIVKPNAPFKNGYLFVEWQLEDTSTFNSSFVLKKNTVIKSYYREAVPTQLKKSFYDLKIDLENSLNIKIIKIKYANELDNTKNPFIISVDNSQYKVYAWYDETNTLYYYTEADKIYLTDNTYKYPYAVEEIDLTKIDTSNLTTMASMFEKYWVGGSSSECKLKSIDLSGFDTSKVTNMSSMFRGCKKLESLDLSNFDTSNVTNMSGMFSGCENLENLNINSFNTSKVTNMGGMFNGLKKIETLDLSHFDTSNVTSMYGIFSDAYGLKNLNLSSFDISNLVLTEDQTSRYYFYLNSIPIINKIITPKKMNSSFSILLYTSSDGNYATNDNIIYDSLSIDTPVSTELTRSYCVRYQVGLDEDPNAKMKCAPVGDALGELWTPTREGYDFIGWNSSKLNEWYAYDFSIDDITGQYFYNSDTILSPQIKPFNIWAFWSLKNITYNFYDSNGESLLGTYKTKYGYHIYEENAPVVSKNGYIFDGWYLDKEFSNKYILDADCFSDLNLYAKWIPEDTTISTTTELIDFGEARADFNNYIRKNVTIKNEGNVSVMLYISNPTSDGPFGSESFDVGHVLAPGETYTATLIVNPNGTNHDVPGTYNSNYKIIALSQNQTKYELEIPAKIVINKLPMKISYTTHVQNIGWQKYVSDGAMAGTSGKAYRLEGIKIKLEYPDYEGNIEYRTHIQNIGWEKNFKKNDEMSGTSGKAYRLEAIEIKLTGEMADHYDVYYRVHAENFGWLGWARNGEQSGTAGYAYRLEGIEIKLVPKDEVFDEYGKKAIFWEKDKGSIKPNPTQQPINPDPVDPPTPSGKLISYTTHVQNIGWQKYVSDGAMAGTEGKAYRLEGIKIKLEDQQYDGDIEYRTHIQYLGWESKFKKNDEMSGTEGKAYRLEAIEIKLTGEMAENYDVYYRVHAENFGWLGWAKNGEQAGTAGYAYRLEGIEIKLLPKGDIPEGYGKGNKPFYSK